MDTMCTSDETVKKGRYRHYKGEFADVIDVAKHSETGEEFVAYYHTEKETGKYILWVRPKAMFFEIITKDGKTMPRFEYVGPNV